MRTARPLGLQLAQPAGYHPEVSAVTATPPYVFPQQKPTEESYEDGHLLRHEGSKGFFWRTKADLKDGDFWVPGCDKFFQDHGEGPNDEESKMTCADRKWQPTAERQAPRNTSRPPYVYPRQKPTKESEDKDGAILVRRRDDPSRYTWCDALNLDDGDVWIPASDKFFADWATAGILTDQAKRNHAEAHWHGSPGGADE